MESLDKQCPPSQKFVPSLPFEFNSVCNLALCCLFCSNGQRNNLIDAFRDIHTDAGAMPFILKATGRLGRMESHNWQTMLFFFSPLSLHLRGFLLSFAFLTPPIKQTLALSFQLYPSHNPFLLSAQACTKSPHIDSLLFRSLSASPFLLFSESRNTLSDIHVNYPLSVETK